MYEDFIRQRIEEFRNKANVSEYQLSLNLGRSKGYTIYILWSITSIHEHFFRYL